MYRIVKTDNTPLAIIETPCWVRLHDNGCFVQTDREQATGVVVGGTVYHIEGTPDLPDRESVFVREVDTGEIIFEQEQTAPVTQAAVQLARMQVMTLDLDDAQKLTVSGLYNDWAPGSYAAGDIRNADGQTWECFQAHDNAVYPDIAPGGAAWCTFWRPLHGTSPETARPFVPVAGAHDMYKAGEYMTYEGQLYKCLADTNYSPTDYAAAWEVVT